MRPSPCTSLGMGFDLVLFHVMITMFIGFSLGLHPAKVSFLISAQSLVDFSYSLFGPVSTPREREGRKFSRTFVWIDNFFIPQTASIDLRVPLSTSSLSGVCVLSMPVMVQKGAWVL